MCDMGYVLLLCIEVIGVELKLALCVRKVKSDSALNALRTTHACTLRISVFAYHSILLPYNAVRNMHTSKFFP